MKNERDPKRMKKTKVDAETQAFTSQLFYFVIKALVVFIFYKYKNILWGNSSLIAYFVFLLIANAYMMITTGHNPGFEPTNSLFISNQSSAPEDKKIDDLQEEEMNEEQAFKIKQIQSDQRYNQDNYCDICLCQKRIRAKHCFRCGRCVRKFDHHCPWVGSCVGESNHFKFLMLNLIHTAQASLAFWICFDSMKFYEYKQDNQTFSSEFGTFALFSFFMFLYILFAGGLFFFHAFLLLSNTTTNELTSREKVHYLRGIKGNPFNKGPIDNIKMAILIPPEGHQWKIPNNGRGEVRERSWLQIIWSNQYYDCC